MVESSITARFAANPWRKRPKPVVPTTHDGLAADLAAWLRCSRTEGPVRITWENIEFPDMGRYQRVNALGIRPDVFSIVATLTESKWAPTIHEVKISRSDFLADVRKGKWEGHKKIAKYIWFACPEGLIDVAELPAGTGLIVRDRYNWHVVKRPTRNPKWRITNRQWMNLCMKAQRPGPYGREGKDPYG